MKPPANGSAGRAPDVWKTLLHVAWLGILLGFVIEAILLSIAAGFGNFQSARPFVADLAQKISWSVIVCVGLAVGSAASKARDVMMGLMGLLAAPVAFYAARSIHKGAMQALSMSGGPAGGPSPLLLAIVKGVEYGCLGIALYWIQQRPWGGAAAHVGGGLVIGIVFAAVILTLTIQAALHPPSLASLIARGANEVIFPVGCALVIFSADVLGKRAQNV